MLEVGGVGLLTAILAGAVSFLSPCVLPLVPGYLSAVSGVAATDLEHAGWRRILPPALIFCAAFSFVFILLGLGATEIGSVLNDGAFEKIAGALMILMGVLFLSAPFLPMLNREWRIEALMERAGTGGPLLAGAAFAFAWSPCIGPTLGAILTLAANTGSTVEAGVTLAFYSAGLAIPFLLTAIAFDRMSSAFAVIKRHYAAIIAAGGLILIAMGVIVFSGELNWLNARALELLDWLGLDFVTEV